MTHQEFRSRLRAAGGVVYAVGFNEFEARQKAFYTEVRCVTNKWVSSLFTHLIQFFISFSYARHGQGTYDTHMEKFSQGEVDLAGPPCGIYIFKVALES